MFDRDTIAFFFDDTNYSPTTEVAEFVPTGRVEAFVNHRLFATSVSLGCDAEREAREEVLQYVAEHGRAKCQGIGQRQMGPGVRARVREMGAGSIGGPRESMTFRKLHP
jgi:hypothetical protein